MKLKITRSPNPNKKFRVYGDGWHTDFGARGYSDYTKHKDPTRKQRYITRHATRENWTRSGIKTAGFWSRWFLWEKPSTRLAKRAIETKFKVAIV